MRRTVPLSIVIAVVVVVLLVVIGVGWWLFLRSLERRTMTEQELNLPQPGVPVTPR